MQQPEMGLAKPLRGQLWEVNFEPQTHKEEPGKRGRPALVVQTDILNEAGHPTTIIVPCTTQIYRDAQGDGYPLRVPIGKISNGAKKAEDTDVLIDQIRAISNHRFMGDQPIAQLSRTHIKRVQEALKLLMEL
jgi:mRNA interferase MazF